MNYLELVHRLSELGVDSPTAEAAELADAVSNKSREWCLLNQTADLPNADSLAASLDKRSTGIPLQYIIGRAWFYGHRFNVSENCLIPQPDTEHVTELAINNMVSNAKLLDLCTGSGCIAISVLLSCPDATAVAVDISSPALDIAKSNASLHGVDRRLEIIKSDVLRDDISKLIASADVIVSNPPYVNSDVIPALSPEVQHEPRLALDGGADGLVFYRHFISALSKHMQHSAVMILEIGYDQHERIARLCKSAGLSCRFHRDFGGNIRVAEIRRNQ